MNFFEHRKLSWKKKCWKFPLLLLLELKNFWSHVSHVNMQLERPIKFLKADCLLTLDNCLLQTMEGHSNAIICIQVVNRLMYTGSADSSAKCWVTEFGDCTRQYKGHKHSVICMKFNKAVCTCCLEKKFPWKQFHEKICIIFPWINFTKIMLDLR